MQISVVFVDVKNAGLAAALTRVGIRIVGEDIVRKFVPLKVARFLGIASDAVDVQVVCVHGIPLGGEARATE
jgi:hypothetical protein